VERDLKRATIQIRKTNSKQQDTPVNCLKHWISTKTYSQDIWFSYLATIWANINEFRKKLIDKSYYLQFTSCSILFLFKHIQLKEIEDLKTSLQDNDDNCFTLYQVLVMLKEVYLETNPKHNSSILFLGYLCKNITMLGIDKNIDPSFSKHRMKKSYSKKINEENTKVFVSEILNISSSENSTSAETVNDIYKKAILIFSQEKKEIQIKINNKRNNSMIIDGEDNHNKNKKYKRKEEEEEKEKEEKEKEEEEEEEEEEENEKEVDKKKTGGCKKKKLVGIK
jgi:hypothetical protein